MKVIEAVIKKAQSSALLNNYDEIFAYLHHLPDSFEQLSLF